MQRGNNEDKPSEIPLISGSVVPHSTSLSSFFHFVTYSCILSLFLNKKSLKSFRVYFNFGLCYYFRIKICLCFLAMGEPTVTYVGSSPNCTLRSVIYPFLLPYWYYWASWV